MRALANILASSLLAIVAQAAGAAPGVLDSTFGTGGRVLTNFTGSAGMSISDVALQPDGKLVAVGQAESSIAVTRLLANGLPDTAFGAVGRVVLSLGYSASASAVALQPDGKIVVAGSAVNGVTIVRFDASGALDPSFNGTGIAGVGGNWNLVAKDIALQPDGKIVVVAEGTSSSALVRYHADGTPDTGFGGASTGILTIPYYSAFDVTGPSAVAIQPDGKIVVAGYASTIPFFAVGRYLPDGSRDPSFGPDNSGMAQSVIGGWYSRAEAVAIQPDGMIVAAGHRMGPVTIDSEYIVARYTVNGFPDTSFNGTGYATADMGPGADRAFALALQPDGRIVVAGDSATAPGPLPSGSNYGVARFNAGGSLDASFSGDGKVTTSVGGSGTFPGNAAFGVVVQPDGRIVAAGATQNGGALVWYLADGTTDPGFFGTGIGYLGDSQSTDVASAVAVSWIDGRIFAAGGSDSAVALARYGPSGSLESKTTATVGDSSSANAMTLDAANRMVIAGSSTSGSTTSFAVLRRDADGLPDATFGTGGAVVTPIGDFAIAYGIALQPDGSIVAAGSTTAAMDGDFALARYTAAGALDPGFGTGGKVATSFGPGDNAAAAAVVAQPDGRIVAVGHASNGANADFAIARYNADGSPDAGFGTGGKVMTAMGAGNDLARAVALQADGRLVVAGQAHDGAQYNIAVARYNADGSPDFNFGNGGKVTTPLGAGDASASAVAIQANGKIVVAGEFNMSGKTIITVVRYLANGTLDAAFGSGGSTLVIFTGAASARSVAISPTGDILVAGFADDGTGADFALVRLVGDDMAAPTTTILAHPGPTSGPVVSFSVGGMDTGSSGLAGFECSLDSAPFAHCGTVIGYTGLAVGTHTFRVRAVDVAGNVDATPAEHTWSVVLQPQLITFAPLPNRVLGNAPFAVAATGGASGAPVVFTSLTAPVCTVSGSTVTLVATGTCTIAADQAGNASYLAAAQVTRSFEVVATGFTLTVSLAGPGAGTVTSNPSGIECGTQCTGVFAPGVAAGLSVTAGGALFSGWSGACSGTGPCTVTMDADKAVTATFEELPVINPRLANLSTRGLTLTGNDVMIGGFIIGGSTPKKVLITARGPSLTAFGVPNALPDPVLHLYSGQYMIASNNDWSTNANAAEIAAGAGAPTHPQEAALLVTLAPGAYTAHAVGALGSTGVAIVEVFERDNVDIPLLNISTRGLVGTGDNVMIGGFVIQGNSPKTVLITARGPSLAAYGITNPLANPNLRLFMGQTLVYQNDDQVFAPNHAQILATGVAPPHPQESAILITLPPGAYTAIVDGQGGTTGVGIVEVFAQ